MPNREGGYGGYRKPSGQKRRVNAPGTGSVRRVVTPDLEEEFRPRQAAPRSYGQASDPSRQSYHSAGQTYRPARPQSAGQISHSSYQQSAGQPRRSANMPGSEPDRQTVYRRPPSRQPGQSARARYQEESDGWIQPPVPPRRRVQPPQKTSLPQQALQAAARRARQDRRLRRRLTLAATAVCIFLMSAVITAVLPDGSSGATAETALDPTAGLTASLVAPLPYETDTQTINGITTNPEWGNVGPVQQTGDYTYTATPQTAASLPAFGRVDLSWFDDAAFLGDSLTVGFTDYNINIGDALVCAYEGASPNQIVNRTTMNSSVRGEEITLDVLSAKQPKKLYVLMGANTLAYSTTNDEGFLNYYGRMLDDLKAALPNTTIFVQSVLPVQAEAVATLPGLSPDRVASINTSLQTMAAEKGCYYLALNEVFTDDSGYLISDYAQPDGLHLTVSGYSAWVDYLCTHVPYDKDNPYQLGSEYYLSDEMRQLLSDLP